MKPTSVSSAYAALEVVATPHYFLKQLICRVFGHRVVNHRLRDAQAKDTCSSCREPLLRENGAPVHIRHNLACFLGGHSYAKTGERNGYCEFICSSCGHPLLFGRADSPYAQREYFRKFVRHRCGWFGHVVLPVSERCGLTEYACHCGHPFLLEAKGVAKVRHPLVCVLTGHSINLLTRRNDHLEFRCRDCGHTFCLADEPGQRQIQL